MKDIGWLKKLSIMSSLPDQNYLNIPSIEFSYIEAQEAIRKLKINKAPGPAHWLRKFLIVSIWKISNSLYDA